MKASFLYASLFVTLLICSDCKKKDAEPEGSAEPSPTEASGSLTVSGITQTLSAESIVYPDHYLVKGMAASGVYNELNATFYNGKPTKDTLVTLSPLHAQPTLNIYQEGNSYSYSAISGQVKIKVIGSTVSLSFTDAVFMRVNDSGDQITASGTLVVLD